MAKNDFVTALKQFKGEVSTLGKVCEKTKDRQIRSKLFLTRIEKNSVDWFEKIAPSLKGFGVSDEKVNEYNSHFDEILKLSGKSPSKKNLLKSLFAAGRNFYTDIIVPVSKSSADPSKLASLNDILKNSVGLELEYLKEAAECAQLGKKRASIILGWGAAIDRLHLNLEKNGFDVFNLASEQMAEIQTGRYKRFKKKFQIQNLSDLRMTVFDNDLLWVVEFLKLIDGNQHDRLQVCYTMRNSCAHPGEAIITNENLLSFFSDIETIVFNNPKFILSPDTLHTTKLQEVRLS